MKKILAMLLVATMIFAMVGCSSNEQTTSGSTDTTAQATPAPVESTEPEVSEEPEETEETEEPEEEVFQTLAGFEYGVDYISLYEQFGKEVTIDMVVEDMTTGLAYVEIDGEEYELGLDFLTMAMVYNTEPAGDYATADDVYAAWWRLYIQRWNYLLPEVPLYSNEYYDLYNSQIKGVQEFPTNPFWSPSNALIDWTSEKEDNSIIIGNTTDLSGKFRYSNFGASSANAADADVSTLTTGLQTVVNTKEGGYVWNDTVVKEHSETINEDGSKTFTITIYDDLLFSDGSPVLAKHYVARPIVFSTPVATEAAARDHKGTMNFVGYEAFAKYDGTEASLADGATKEISGVRLIDDYTFSLTVDAQYLPYFYDITYASLSPQWIPMWMGECDVADDGNGVYITGDFYAKEGDSYTLAAHIAESARNTDTTYPYSGPYMVVSYDPADKSAVMEANPNFKGNYEGVKPAIAKVVYKKIVSKTQLEDLKAGGLDVIAGITGGDETNEALALADSSDGKFVYSHYSRAGYGKLGFRADYGPVQFTEVRQAIAYCMDRAKFAKDFTGGYGGVVDGPYYTGAWMYKAAVEQGMLLNAYATSVDSAIATLEEGGWIYDKDGNEYVEGVRYKKIPGEYASENDINYKSKDGAYVTTKVGDDYYMPLALNWYGTTDNPFTDQLLTGFMTNDNMINAGFVVQNTIGEFNPMLDELYQDTVYGYYSGSPMYSVFNFATSFGTAVYDYSYNMTIDPSMYENYSSYYIKDFADAYWLK